jgi:hypothetical protein
MSSAYTEDEAYDASQAAAREIARAGRTVATAFFAKQHLERQRQQSQQQRGLQQGRPEAELTREPSRAQQPQAPVQAPSQQQDEGHGLGR